MITSLTPWWYPFHDLIKCKDDNLQISLCPFPEIPHCWETSSVSVNALSSPSWFISDGVSASEAKRQYYGYIVVNRVNMLIKETFVDIYLLNIWCLKVVEKYNKYWYVVMIRGYLVTVSYIGITVIESFTIVVQQTTFQTGFAVFSN